MGNRLYEVTKGGLCPGCGYNRDDMQHYRIHVPRSKWPVSMGVRKERVVVDGLVYDADRAPHVVSQTMVMDAYEIPEAIRPAVERTAIDIQAVSGEASSLGSPDLPKAEGAGSASSPEAATIIDHQTIYIPDHDEWASTDADGITTASGVCTCGYTVPVASKNPSAAMRMHRKSAKAHKD